MSATFRSDSLPRARARNVFVFVFVFCLLLVFCSLYLCCLASLYASFLLVRYFLTRALFFLFLLIPPPTRPPTSPPTSPPCSSFSFSLLSLSPSPSSSSSDICTRPSSFFYYFVLILLLLLYLCFLVSILDPRLLPLSFFLLVFFYPRRLFP